MNKKQATENAFIPQAGAFIVRESLVIASAATLSTVFLLIVIWDKRVSAWSTTSSVLVIAAIFLTISFILVWLTNKRWLTKTGYSQRLDTLSSSLSDLLSASNFADTIFYEHFFSLSQLRDGKQFPAKYLLDSTSSGDISQLINDTKEQIKDVKLTEINNIERYKFHLDEVKFIADQVGSQIPLDGKGASNLKDVASIINSLKSHLDKLPHESQEHTKTVLKQVDSLARDLNQAINQTVKNTIEDFR